MVLGAPEDLLYLVCVEYGRYIEKGKYIENINMFTDVVDTGNSVSGSELSSTLFAVK